MTAFLLNMGKSRVLSGRAYIFLPPPPGRWTYFIYHCDRVSSDLLFTVKAIAQPSIAIAPVMVHCCSTSATTP